MLLFIAVAAVLGMVGLVFAIRWLSSYHKSLYPLLPWWYNFGKRRDTFAKTLRLLSERKAKTLIETGTARYGLSKATGDGASTVVFGTWANLHTATLHSVDISEISTVTSQHSVKKQGLENAVTIYCEDSLTFLERFDQPVDFLYLDSYDYSATDPEIQIKSQIHHLQEFQRIEHQLHEKSIVLIDDCDLPGGGKGKTTIEYMLQKNWKILMSEYQVLLIR